MGRWIFFINFGRRIKSRPQETCDRYTFAKLHYLPNGPCLACARQDWNGLGAIVRKIMRNCTFGPLSDVCRPNYD